ncbi:hypothetical protein AJ85_03715 [Alkalihalobacillus alcalophilus ATCC 27647 = CGMCC 1.3604]|uniref:Uncharacterized protein n=1 Tax=Alkalihalobacillus alcalophilus ATCC 27647 = CGMCC 1.3604 TaxID=1218173 RepID=A0A094WK32_ALKAL|nr:hypothetical protein [Alkalihalobacillus alcalophilus]KGA96293.1 hypothetical protein BALCAV_0217225 [Alkalihalobacillus alcalophilus ATCC 27647 = CGMCC 1.3604]MED1563394.1 hypothetical protein [Alkalihalobacillus alcalophilus]THG91638.1 hypothetical protein AJ85_03715 [Alkalihalobacillus alcalophilus ATCC 27647 = CGMCC 1.3604]
MKESGFEQDRHPESQEQESAKLIVDLLLYSQKLEKMIIELRKEVNFTSPKYKPLPYPELHSDIYENFDDYHAYIKHREYIELFFRYE